MTDNFFVHVFLEMYFVLTQLLILGLVYARWIGLLALLPVIVVWGNLRRRDRFACVITILLTTMSQSILITAIMITPAKSAILAPWCALVFTIGCLWLIWKPVVNASAGSNSDGA